MRKIAVVFPGQGSQCVGMLSGLENHPSVRETLEEADSILGYSISPRGFKPNGAHATGLSCLVCGRLSGTG